MADKADMTADVPSSAPPIKIVRLDRYNYPLFDDMLHRRRTGGRRTNAERTAARLAGFHENYIPLANPNLYIFAAQSGDLFVGWITVVYIPRVGVSKGLLQIEELWVDPDFRRAGIATQLTEKAEELCGDMGTSDIALCVDAESPEARALFTKRGYLPRRALLLMTKEA